MLVFSSLLPPLFFQFIFFALLLLSFVLLAFVLFSGIFCCFFLLSYWRIHLPSAARKIYARHVSCG